MANDAAVTNRKKFLLIMFSSRYWARARLNNRLVSFEANMMTQSTRQQSGYRIRSIARNSNALVPPLAAMAFKWSLVLTAQFGPSTLFVVVISAPRQVCIAGPYPNFSS